MSATGTPDEWALAAGASKTAAVNQPDDEDVTCVEAAPTVADLTQAWAVADPSPTPPAVITRVVLHVRAKRTVGASVPFHAALELSGNVSNGAQRTLNAAYTGYSDEFTSKPGGGAWTWAAVSSMTARVVAELSPSTQRVTSVYAVVDYVPAGCRLPLMGAG